MSSSWFRLSLSLDESRGQKLPTEQSFPWSEAPCNHDHSNLRIPAEPTHTSVVFRAPSNHKVNSFLRG